MKELMEFDYVEVDGLLYPRIEIDGKEVLDDLGKYGRMRLECLRECKPEMYQELLVSGKLAEHCKSMDDLGFELAEQIWTRYLECYSISDEDLMERVQWYTMSQGLIDEVILRCYIYC